MPQPKNHLLRVLVPVMAVIVGGFVAFAVFKGSSAQSKLPAAAAAQPQPAAQPPATTPAVEPNPVPATGLAEAPKPAVTPAPAPLTVPTTYTAVHAAGAASAPLGSLDPQGDWKAQIQFSVSGSGIKSLALAEHYEDITDAIHVEVQGEKMALHPDRAPDILVPFSALAVEITPQGGGAVIVPLAGTDVWQAKDGRPGAFEATIVDGSGAPALRLERVYTLTPKSLEIRLSQHITNLSPIPMSVRWFEAGPVDLSQDATSYGGDKRRVRFGYLLPPAKDPTQAEVQSNGYLLTRPEALGKRETLVGPGGVTLLDGAGQAMMGFNEKPLWPSPKMVGDQLVWVGATNRYFGVAALPLTDAAAPKRPFAWVAGVSRVVLDAGPGQESVALRLESAPLALGPAGGAAGTADVSHAIYAGPLNRYSINADPLFKAMGLSGIVMYNFGGMCAPCTFGFMTDLLLWILHTLHDLVFHDWSFSIIFLVLIVRSCLHPVTKWSQIRMARFGKQMQGVGPKQKILQERYKADPKKLQEETAKLWREEGISPAGFLGCLPMVLQMPVWIALYASLYFSVELRHQHAFYGIFQRVQPMNSPFWRFLGDLAEPDRFYYFAGKTVATLPLLGPITSINILPVILAVVFFIQQKYLTPPTAATMTPEQEFQQKMMRWMTVFMFPVFMYNAPSGLAIYFICNSTFAILESKYIRSHMAKYDLLDLEKMKAKRGGKGTSPQGILARLQDLAAAKQEEAMKKSGRPGLPKRR